MNEQMHQDRVLNTIRALLAKAESTPYEAEAEAFVAKAQELMAKHSIDAAMASVGSTTKSTPGSREFHIDNPYWRSKGMLLSAIVRANHCRSLWDTRNQIIEVFGFETDLESVDLLFTSLLVQAIAALQKASKAERGSSDIRSFRKSFLDGFAIRMGERLRTATLDIEAASQKENTDTLPVLAGRDLEVKAAVEKASPNAGKIRLSTASNLSGFYAGKSAANAASLKKTNRLSA